MKNVTFDLVKALDKRSVSVQAAGVVIAETVTITPEKGLMGDYLTAIQEHGGLFDQAKAARLAGVHRSRINQLVLSGRLPLVNVLVNLGGAKMPLEQLIPGNALLAWMREPKAKGGRPMHRKNRPELQAA